MTDPTDQRTNHGEADPIVRGENPMVTRSQEQLLISKPWFPYRRYRIGKRVVTETRTVTVEVRREELVFEDLGPVDVTHVEADVLSDGPLEIVLHQEQVTVQTVAVPVERYRFGVERVQGPLDVQTTLAQEQISVD